MGAEAGNLTHPKPSGPLVKWYLGKTVRGVGVKDTVQKVLLNGYKYEVRFGAVNETPKEVYELFRTAVSRSVVPDLEKAVKVPTFSGDARMGSGYKKIEEQSDYELSLISEEKEN